jgi:signal transduction histidine kinase
MAGKVVRPVYLYALAGVVAALVLASGALQITRTKRELVSIYEGSARSLADGAEQLVGQALSMLDVSGHGPADAAKTFALDDVLLDYLFGLAADLDRTLPSATSGEVRVPDPEVSLRVVHGDAPEALGDAFLMHVIRFLERGVETVAIRRLPPAPDRPGRLLVVFRRHLGPGFLVFTVEDTARAGLLKRLLMEDVVRLFRDRHDLLDLILVDDGGRVLARAQDESVSKVPPPQIGPLAGKGHQGEILLTRHGETPALDLTRDLRFGGREVGAVRVSVSVLAMEKLLSTSRRWTVLLSTLLFLVGFALVRLIVWRQERTLRRVREMEEEIRRREELSALGEMAAGVAHEIRNPLNAISMGLQSLALEGGEGKGQGSPELLETMRREVARINRIVGEFLSVSRPVSLHVEVVNLNELAEHVASLLRQAGGRDGLTVRTDLPRVPVYLSGDRDRLTQALLNLGINALEACASRGEVTVSIIAQKKRVRVEVSDTGPGVPPEHQPNLFRPHFTTKEKGLGLGLFIAQRIVQVHGGTVALGETSSRGTTMVVTLPVTELTDDGRSGLPTARVEVGRTRLA